MQTYFRGDTIIFDIGSETLDLDGVDFVIFVYRNPDAPEIKIEKSDMSRQAADNYRATISAETTKDLPVGRYALEIYLKGTSRRIYFQADFINLRDSASKTDA